MSTTGTQGRHAFVSSPVPLGPLLVEISCVNSEGFLSGRILGTNGTELTSFQGQPCDTTAISRLAFPEVPEQPSGVRVLITAPAGSSFAVRLTTS